MLPSPRATSLDDLIHVPALDLGVATPQCPWGAFEGCSEMDIEKIYAAEVLGTMRHKLERAQGLLQEKNAEALARQARIDEYDRDVQRLVVENAALVSEQSQLASNHQKLLMRHARRTQRHEELKEQHTHLLLRFLDPKVPPAHSPRDVLLQKRQCPVCLDSRPACIMLPCFHTCCQSCAVQWYKENQTLQCPECRALVQFTHDAESSLTVKWTGDAPCVLTPHN